MQEVLKKLLLYLILAAAGVVLRKIGALKLEDRQVVINLMMYLTLPCAIISGFMDSVLEPVMLLMVLVAIVYHGVQLAITLLRTRKQNGVAKSVGIIHSSALNVGNFAMPMTQGLLAPSAFVYAGIFDSVCTIFTLGIHYALASYYAEGKKQGMVRTILKKLLHSIPFLVYFVLIVMMVFRLRFPAIVYQITGQIAQANGVLAMVLAGIVLDLHIPRKWIKPMAVILTIRYGVGLSFSIAAHLLFTQSPVVYQTLTMCLLAPYSNGILFFSKECKCDPKFSAALLGLSIVITLFFYTILQLIWF